MKNKKTGLTIIIFLVIANLLLAIVPWENKTLISSFLLGGQALLFLVWAIIEYREKKKTKIN